MGNSDPKACAGNRQARQVASTPGEAPSHNNGQKKSKSMHDDVPVWYDCCSCEAEPYWLEWLDGADNPKNSD